MPSSSQEIFDANKLGHIPVSIIGCGATGSHVVMSLIELGCRNIKIYDDDIVEAHNLHNQLWTQEHIGQAKVDAMRACIDAKLGHIPEGIIFRESKITAYNAKDRLISNVVFLLTDTMSSRAEIGEALPDDCLWLIETRMAATYGNVFSVDPLTQREAWMATLQNDEEVETSACGTAISCSATSKIIANLAVWQFIHWANNELDEICPRTNIFLKPLMMATAKL